MAAVRPSRSKVLWSGTAVAAGVLVVVFGLAGGADAPARTAGDTPAASVTRRDLTRTLRLSGHIELSDTRALNWLQPAAAVTGSSTTGNATTPASRASVSHRTTG